MNAVPRKAEGILPSADSHSFGYEKFEQYILRFNAKDATAFDYYLAQDVCILNGTLELRGIQGMKDHYEGAIWPFFDETIRINRFVSDGQTLAVSMWTHFVATRRGESLFGPLSEGDAFDFRGLVMYEIEATKFSKITVAYNSFIRTSANGAAIDLGLPH